MNSDRAIFIIFLRVTLIISLTSWVVQYIISIITNNIYKNKNKWLFFGKEENYKNFLKKVNLKYKKLAFERIDINSDLTNFQYESLEGVILESSDEVTAYDLERYYF